MPINEPDIRYGKPDQAHLQCTFCHKSNILLSPLKTGLNLARIILSRNIPVRRAQPHSGVLQMKARFMRQQTHPYDSLRLSMDPEDDPAMVMARNRRQRIDRARALIEARIKGENTNELDMGGKKNRLNPRAVAHTLRHALKRTPS